MSNGQAAGEDAPWWELSGYSRHAACLIAARSGDRDALHAIVAELSPLVWHVARGQGLQRPAAEDVVQTVWLTLLKNLHKVAEPRALANWLITTTRREALHTRRGPERFESQSDETLDEFPTDHGLPEHEAITGDRDRRLWRAYAKLPQRCQELLRLTVLAGRAEYGAVAEALRMPRGSIGPTRGRCLTTLRDLLTTEGGMT